MVRSLGSLRLDDPHIIDLVDPHFSGCMDNLIGVEQNADMCDPPFFIIEKSQIAGPRFFQESYRLPLTSLQPGIPQERNPQEFENALRKPAAVYPENTLSTPEIGCIEKFVGELPDRFWIGFCGCRIPDPALVMDLVLPPLRFSVFHRR